jgi:hypothetical protein
MDTFERAIEARHAMELEIGYAMWAVDAGREWWSPPFVG